MIKGHNTLIRLTRGKKQVPRKRHKRLPQPLTDYNVYYLRNISNYIFVITGLY